MMNYEDIALRSILQKQINNPNQNYYPWALLKAKVQGPTPQILSMLIHLVSNQPSYNISAKNKGTRWLQVIRRLSVNNYSLVYNACVNSFGVVRILLAEARNFASPEQIVHLERSIFRFELNPFELNYESRLILLDTYKNFIEVWIMLESNARLEELTNFFNRKESLLIRLIREMITYVLKDSESALKNLQTAKVFEQVLQNLIQICNLHFIEEQKALKSFKLFSFRKHFQQLIHFLEFACENLLHLLPSIMDFKWLKEDLLISYLQVLQKMSRSSQYLPIFANHRGKVTDYSIETIMQELTQIEKSENFKRSQQMSDLKQFLAAQEDMTHHMVSQTLICTWCRFTKQINSNVDGYINDSAQKLLKTLERNESFIELSAVAVVLAILKEPLSQRDDLMAQLITKMFQKQLKCLNITVHNSSSQIGTQEQISQCRVIRFFSNFHRQIFEKCGFNFQKCFQVLLLNFFQESNLWIKEEATQVLETMVRNEFSRGRIRDNIGAYSSSLIRIFSQASQSALLNEKSFRLLQNFLDAIPEFIRKDEVEWIKLISKQFLRSLQQCWTHKCKMNPSIYAQLGCLNTVINRAKNNPELTSQTYKEDVPSYFQVQGCLGPIVGLLKDPARIQFSEELIQILGNLLTIASTVTPVLCEGILCLQEYFKHSDMRMGPINNIVNIICTEGRIPHEIEFQYSNLIQFIGGILNEFMAKKLRLLHDIKNYRGLTVEYVAIQGRDQKDELNSTLMTIQLFIQTFEQHIRENSQLFDTFYDNAVRIRRVMLKTEAVQKYINSESQMLDQKYCSIFQQTKFAYEQLPQLRAYQLFLQLILTLNHIRPFYNFYEQSRPDFILKQWQFSQKILLKSSWKPLYTLKLFILTLTDPYCNPKLTNEAVFDEKVLLKCIQLVKIEKHIARKLTETSKNTHFNQLIPFQKIEGRQFLSMSLRLMKDKGWIDGVQYAHYVSQIN